MGAKLDVTAFAAKYMLAEFELGLSVSRLIVERSGFEGDKKTLLTHFPVNVSTSSDLGSSAGQKIAYIRDAVIEHVTDFLSQGNTPYAIFEAFLSRPSDCYLQTAGLPYTVLGDEVFIVLTRENAGLVRRAFQFARSATSVIVILGRSQEASAFTKPVWNTVDGEAAAASATEIICGALDGEGAIICNLSEVSPPALPS